LQNSHFHQLRRWLLGSLSEIAFHEKAGRSQVEFFILRATLSLFCPLAADAMLPFALFVSDSFSLGAGWAFSLQPVLPPDYRPALPSQG
jgi:hypothetical protein